MRLVRYETAGRALYGLVEDGTVYELVGSPFDERPTRGAAAGPLESLKLLAPCTPSKVALVAHNYGWDPSQKKGPVPAMLLKPATAVVGPEDNIVYPEASQRVIFESELCVVVGRSAHNVAVDAAKGYILGYTCGNDVTALDLVQNDPMPTRGKSFDTFCPLGPVIVTDLDPADVAITCRVNGEVRASGSTKQMFRSAEELLSFVSSVMTLNPGDVIMTGTPGIGDLQRGDVVEVDIAGIGVLRNRVV
jgi:2-keto-4-pentenoate hydratase/2-oxohepta-3-ene-1,7-dioic acid hydratase in catechol pathway